MNVSQHYKRSNRHAPLLLPHFLPAGALACVWLLVLGSVIGRLPWQFHRAAYAEPLPFTTADSPLTQGDDALRRGSFEEAVAHWQRAAQHFADTGKTRERTEALLRLATVQQTLGQYVTARRTLENALTLATEGTNPKLRALALVGLSSVALAAGALEEAAQRLNESTSIAQQLGDTHLDAIIRNNQGNLLAAQTRYSEALAAFRESADLADTVKQGQLATTALTNAAKAAIHAGQHSTARDLLTTVLTRTHTFAASHDKASLLLTLGLLALEARHADKADGALWLLAARAFAEAGTLADVLHDHRTASYAWGYLGKLYEEEGSRDDEALQLTRRALFAAQQINAPESLYLWQWQAGRLLNKRKDLARALAVYTGAVETLESIRPILLQRSNDPRFFRESVEPVYFEFVDLLLQRARTRQDPERQKKDLLDARKTIENLKVAELRDYFQDECVDAELTKNRNLDDIVSQETAVIYPIPLQNRLELLVTLPGGVLKSIQVAVTKDTLTQELDTFRRTITRRFRLDYAPHARQLYNWLIRPLESELAAVNVKTLVFVPHGMLRTIPIAALHDGTQFLIERYALAITPGLTLTDPHPLRREQVNMLAAGLTEAVQDFPPLPYVATELDDLRQLYGGDPLLNQEFVTSRVEQQLTTTAPSIVHFATHGQFSRDRTQTFLLTYRERLTLDRLGELIRPLRFREAPIELLTLSACETAAGDERAALGLAGVAVKAGVRSALATLWHVDDEAAAILVAEFYKQLNKKGDPPPSRAEALRQAQLKLLHDSRALVRHPGTWSQFLLINNWL